jgi:hypothetical protein
MTQDIPVLLLKGAAEPGRPKVSKTILCATRVNEAFLPHRTSSLMDGVSVVRRLPLALAKNLQLHGSRLPVNLDMDLGALAVVLGFGPDRLRTREKFQRMDTSCSLDGLRILGTGGRSRSARIHSTFTVTTRAARSPEEHCQKTRDRHRYWTGLFQSSTRLAILTVQFNVGSQTLRASTTLRGATELLFCLLSAAV